MELGTTGGSAVIRGLDEIANLDLDPTKTMRDVYVSALKNNLSDNTLEQRKQILNESTNGMYVTLDKDDIPKYNKLLTDFRKISEIPELVLSKKRLTKLFKNRELLYRKGGASMAQKLAAAMGKLSNEIPDGLTKIMNRQALELKEVFAEEYSKFSDVLEKLPIDEGAAYGYNGWSKENKQEFNEKHYKEKIEPLFKRFDDELKAYQEAEKPKIVEEETHEKKYSALHNDKAPNHYLELHDMMYPESSEGKARIRPSNLLERFKIAVVGLQAGIKEVYYKKDAKGNPIKIVPGSIANFHKGIKGAFIADDIKDWFEKSIDGLSERQQKDPVKVNKKLKQLWEWGLYIIQRQQHYIINNNSNLSKEVKESRIKLYDEGIKAEKMPESIRDLAGGNKKKREIIAVWDKRNPWPPKEGTTTNPSSAELSLYEKKRKAATESDSVVDEVLNWIFTPRK